MTDTTQLPPLQLPADPTGWSDWLRTRCSDNLDLVRTGVADLKSQPPGESLAVLSAWNDIMVALRAASSAASLVSQVHPDEEIRAQAETAEQAASRLSTDLSLDRALYDLVDGLRAVAVALGAYVPETSSRILAALGQPDDLAWSGVAYGRTGATEGIEAAAPLFPRIDAPAVAV